jgi:nicotinamide riboside transporter PnuC
MWTILMSPHGLTLIARAVLLSFLAVVGLGVFGPVALSEPLGWASDVAWRAPCLFVIALLAQASLPAFRRKDLTLLTMVFACGLELTVGLVGRQPSLATMIAGVAGVAAAWLPGAIDHLRTRYRGQRYVAIVGK